MDGNIFGYVIKGDMNDIQEQSNTPKMPAFTVNTINIFD
jgi:hypothetical protein